MILSKDEQVNCQLEHCQVGGMGMSHDFVEAVAEGATLVRVGTDIFGHRDYGGQA